MNGREDEMRRFFFLESITKRGNSRLIQIGFNLGFEIALAGQHALQSVSCYQ